MEHFLGVDEGDSVEDLLDHYSNLLLIDLVVLAGDELLEVLLVVVEHYFEQLLLRLVDDLQQRHDIRVILQSLQQRDLSQRARRNTLLLALEFYVFHSDGLVVLVDRLVDSPESPLSDLADFLVSLHLPLNSK